jgi:hypothetical protein
MKDIIFRVPEDTKALTATILVDEKTNYRMYVRSVPIDILEKEEIIVFDDVEEQEEK